MWLGFTLFRLLDLALPAGDSTLHQEELTPPSNESPTLHRVLRLRPLMTGHAHSWAKPALLRTDPFFRRAASLNLLRWPRLTSVIRLLSGTFFLPGVIIGRWQMKESRGGLGKWVSVRGGGARWWRRGVPYTIACGTTNIVRRQR